MNRLKSLPLLVVLSSLVLLKVAAGPAGAAPPPISLKAEPLGVAPKGNPQSQLVRLHLEGEAPKEPVSIRVEMPGKPPAEIPFGVLAPDQRQLTIPVPSPDQESQLTVALSSGGAKATATATVRPLRPWRLFLVQHSHTDIGYTDQPSRVNVEHLEFLDEAVRACGLTDGYPDAARFRWTCEGTWAVERYFRERSPEKIAAFLQRVNEKRIEVTGMCMNMTDLASEEVVIRSFYPVRRLREKGIAIHSAMQCDVNGYPWALPELLQDAGITGFAGGINQTRSTLPFQHPRAIAWEAPSGGSVLAWRGEHYMFANMMGFRDSIDKTLERLPAYLDVLEKKGYPYKVALLQMAGYHTDNAAPCHRASDLVKEWNERFSIPEVRLATLSEWFDALRGERLAPSSPGQPEGTAPSPLGPPEATAFAPSLRKAWPDWWADGVGSAALEAAGVREAQESLSFAEAFLSLARAANRGQPDLRESFSDAYLLACLYDEHTFGAAESISLPHSANTKIQWSEKATHGHRARWLAKELEGAALAAWGEAAVPKGETGIAVFNSLSWPRSGPSVVKIPRGFVEEGTAFAIIDPETGNEVPCQFRRAARNYREFELVAREVPPFGYRVYLLKTERPAPAPESSPFSVQGNVLSNGLVRVELDPARAAIAGIYLAGSSQNLVNPKEAHGFNQFIHERIVSDKGRMYLWPMVSHQAAAFKHEVAKSAEVKPGANGPARASLKLISKVATPAGEIRLESEISLYRDVPVVTIENRVQKPEITDPEACYFAFPFGGDSPPRADLVGGVMVPGRDQIPGSASDWHALQRWARVEGKGRDAVWATVDAPLVQFGNLNTGRWGQNMSFEKPLLYSWVMNNYWFTNFLVSQRGDFVFRYAVAGGDQAASDAAAQRFGMEACSPLKGTVATGRGEGAWRRSFLRLEPAEVVAVALKEAEKESGTLILRLRNYGAGPANARIRLQAPFSLNAAARASILEEERTKLPLHDGAAELEIGSFRLETVLLRVGQSH